MGWISDIGAAGFDSITNIAKLGYNIFQDQRDYRRSVAMQDYQKALQQQIFAREDTSLVRRMQDAKNAGLNPFSVAGGSGAGAGSVVGIGSAEGQQISNIGSMLDTLTSLERYKQSKIETKFQEDSFDKRLISLGLQNDFMYQQFRNAAYNSDSSYYDYLSRVDDYYSGYGFHRDWHENNDGVWEFSDTFYDNNSRPNTPYSDKIKFSTNALKYDSLSKEQSYNFINSDKMVKYAGEFLRFMQLFN